MTKQIYMTKVDLNANRSLASELSSETAFVTST